MVVQYPHTVSIATVQNAVQDGNGDFTSAPAAGSPSSFVGRAESSTGDGYINAADGSQVSYSWILYMPSGTPEQVVGATVTVMNGSELLCKESVKRFSRGQFNCMIWL